MTRKPIWQMLIRGFMVFFLGAILLMEFQFSSVAASIEKKPNLYTHPTTSLIEVTDNILDEYPDAAYSDPYDEYFVVWRREKSINGKRLSGRGEVISSEYLLVSVTTSQIGPPKVAYD